MSLASWHPAVEEFQERSSSAEVECFFYSFNSLLIQVQGAVVKFRTKPLIAVFCAFVLLLPATALAAPCDVKNNSPLFIRPSQSGLVSTISCGSRLSLTRAQISTHSLLETRQGNIPSHTITTLVAYRVGLSGCSPCLVASNNLLDSTVTGDFAAGTGNCPWGDTYERHTNTSVYLGGKI